MMRRVLVLTALGLAVPITAFAHVTVNPRTSKPAVEETYSVRVPTEKQVATTSVDLEVPEGVVVSAVPAADDAKHEEKRRAGRIVMITWTKEIKPRENAVFTFVATNPSAGTEIVWKVHQRYSDGTISDWAPVTKLTTDAAASQQTSSPAGAIETWLKDYDTAFNAKDLDRLATFYHPDVTIYEGGGINTGWIDYRDNHLGRELKSYQNLQFTHGNTRVQLLPGGNSAYATSEYSLKAKAGERDIDARGLETLVLVKGPDGAWKIRHAHTSSRPARRPPAV
ncbi:MAG TPA: DUF1775 domain-containing protein [Vicinamibacterales bacterium]|nr:DUF1775 domain-containing protein [Vicinamibacterales bacterium]